MYDILVLNHIAQQGLDQLPSSNYHIADESSNPDAILLRSHQLHNMHISEKLQAVARAGAGVNNIPVEKLSKQGIPVFNTPGANANAVKELVIAGMLLACRHIHSAWQYTHTLNGNDPSLNKNIEQQKKQFAGFELPGKTIAVIGLGAIGVQVANAAVVLGMKVIGFDPAITIERAWQLSADVVQANNMNAAISEADFVTVHVPYSENTHHLINGIIVEQMKKNAILLNFARGEICDESAIIKALDDNSLQAYVYDFPSSNLLNAQKVICLPHLGASTAEAENNCAVMAARTLKIYLETGNIINSVNFPRVDMPRNGDCRMTIANANIPNMVGQISTHLADAGLNIVDMINKSRDNIAYTIVDTDQRVPDSVLSSIAKIEGILRVRLI